MPVQTGAFALDLIDAGYAPMAEWYAADQAVLELANEGTYVVSGCVITPSATTGKFDMTSGVVMIGGAPYTVAGGTALGSTIAALVTANTITSGKGMWVGIEADTSGTPNQHAGSVTTVATAAPVKPTITASRCLVGWQYIYFDPSFSSPTTLDSLWGTANGNAKLMAGGATCGNLYALLAGFPGGQTLKGDTAASGNLTLMSTSHATKGKVIIGSSAFDEVNTRLGIGTTSPAYALDVSVNLALASGTGRPVNIAGTLDAISAASTSATFQGAFAAVSSGPTATAFTGSLVGLQSLVVHAQSVNFANLYGMLGNATIGASGATVNASATNLLGAQFQVANRSALVGTGITGEMTGVSSSVSNVGRSTVTLMAGFRALLTSANGTDGAGSNPVGTTTNLVGFDVGFSFFSNGTYTNVYGLRIPAWPAGPTYTNTPFGISVAGTGSLNWIAGNTQIGNASQPSSISKTLFVNGTTELGGDVTVDEGKNFVLGTTTGTKFGTSTAQKIGFFNATPIVQGTAFTQTYATASHAHANVTATNPPAGGTGATAGAYDTSAHRDAMITSLTANIADVANVKQVLNALIDDLQALGLVA